MKNIKTVYFDTCIYDAIIDDENFRFQILALKKNKAIEIIISDYIFNELVCTWLGGDCKSKKRTQKLFECVFMLMSNRILRQQETIIRNEIKSFLNNSNHLDVFLNQNKVASIKNTIERLVNGEEITNVNCLSDIGDRKKINHNKFKGIIKKHNIRITKQSRYKNFEDWYDSPDVVTYEKDLIEKLVNQKILHNTNFDIIQKVQENKSNLVHLKGLLRMYAAYQFALLTYKKPRKGDVYDMKHFVCSATIDILVCDNDFLSMLKWVYPEKYCCTKETFLDVVNY